MKSKIDSVLPIFCLLTAILLVNCTQRQYNFSLKDTLAIFLLNNGNDNYFCIPIQYMGDFQVDDFEFTGGYIFVGDYEIPLKKDTVTIETYFNGAAGEYAYTEDGLNCHYIFIEKHLSKAEMQQITSEYKKENKSGKVYVEYDITLDNNPQKGSGMLDDFELYDGVAIDPVWFPTNLNFFKEKYLQK